MSKKESNNTTEELAIDFVKNTVRAIEAQLKIEIPRNGFSLEDLRKGKIKLNRAVSKAESDPRFICESFYIGKRLIMAVKWDPRGFIIERNSEEAANAIKVNPSFAIKKNSPVDFILNATEREVDIESRAQKYLNSLKPGQNN